MSNGNTLIRAGRRALQRGFNRRLDSDQNETDIGELCGDLERGGNHDSRAVVTAHRVEGDRVAGTHPDAPSVAPILDDLPSPVVSVRAHMVTEVGFSGRRLSRRCRSAQRVMSPTHSTLGSRLSVLLDRHSVSPVGRLPAAGSMTTSEDRLRRINSIALGRDADAMHEEPRTDWYAVTKAVRRCRELEVVHTIRARGPANSATRAATRLRLSAPVRAGRWNRPLHPVLPFPRARFR